MRERDAEESLPVEADIRHLCICAQPHAGGIRDQLVAMAQVLSRNMLDPFVRRVAWNLTDDYVRRLRWIIVINSASSVIVIRNRRP